jgi:hypothetical protein
LRDNDSTVTRASSFRSAISFSSEVSLLPSSLEVVLGEERRRRPDHRVVERPDVPLLVEDREDEGDLALRIVHGRSPSSGGTDEATVGGSAPHPREEQCVSPHERSQPHGPRTVTVMG